MVDRNVMVVRRAVEEIWNGRDLDVADSIFAPSYLNHGGLIPDLVCGPEAIKISVALYRTAFPELSITIDRLVEDGNMVELGWTAHGSSGDLSSTTGAGSPPEALAGTTTSRLSGGRIVESWTSWDHEGVLGRLTRPQGARSNEEQRRERGGPEG